MAEARKTVATPAWGVAPPRYRLPPSTTPGRVHLQVADLERSLAYYGRVLGLRVLRRSGGKATLGAGAGARPLIELHERRGVAPVPGRGRLGLYHYAILLPDRTSLGSFVRHLSELGERAGASDHRVSEAIYLRDPDGLGIEVYADRPRSGWAHRDRQLLMATDPLDLEDLMGAAAGRSWTGMPRDAVMGHLHLHVGDLDTAAAFYHAALGLDKVVWSYPGALFLSAGGYHHHLGLNTWSTGAPAGEDDARLLEWELLLPSPEELDRVHDSLREAGYAAERASSDVLARDPWGTMLRLSAGRPAPGPS